MKVILIKDVARLGRKSEVKEVPDGHAINFLIPRKLAVIATQDQLRRLTEETKKHGEHHQHELKVFSDACALLKTKNVVYAVDANEQGHLFKGINVNDIVAHLATHEHIQLDPQRLTLEHPIKDVGVHEIPLVWETISGVCTLEVVKK